MDINQLTASKESRHSSAAALLGFCLIIIFVRLFLRGSLLELDEAEQIVLAQHFSWGYLNQPPLYNWLQYSLFHLFGANLFSLIALKSVLLLGCLFYYHHICQLHCKNSLLAWCATVSWALIPAISLDLLKDNTHSVLALLMACISWYIVFKPQSLSSFGDYCILGLVMGCGLLSKYNYLFFLLPLLLTILSIEEIRSRVKPAYLFLSFSLALLIASPYLIWLYHFASIGLHASYKLVSQDKSVIHGALEVFKGSLLFILPVYIISQIFFPQSFSFRPKTLESRIVNVYFIYALACLIILVLAFGIKNFETRWLIPIFFIVPVLFFSPIKENQFNPKRFARYMVCCLLLQGFFISALVYRAHFGNQRNLRFPFTELVHVLKQSDSSFNYILSDSFWLLGNLYTQTGTDFRFIDTLTPFQYPKGHLFLTWMGAETPSWVQDLFPNQEIVVHPVYSKTRPREILGGWSEYNGPMPLVALV